MDNILRPKEWDGKQEIYQKARHSFIVNRYLTMYHNNTLTYEQALEKMVVELCKQHKELFDMLIEERMKGTRGTNEWLKNNK